MAEERRVTSRPAPATAHTGAEPLEGDRPRRFTTAQVYCAVVGLVLVILGALGFTENGSFNEAEFAFDFEGDPVHGDLFLGMEVNGWHNVFHILTGVILLAGAVLAGLARAVALGFGAFYLAVAVLGWIDGNDVFDTIPTNTVLNIVHTALALTAIAAALIARRELREGRVVPPRQLAVVRRGDAR